MGKPDRRHRAPLALAVLAALSVRSAAAQGLDVEQLKSQVVALMNQQRANSGLPPLQRSALLDSAAQAYSQAMMQATAGGPVYLSHTGPDGSSLAGRISATGYDWYTLGEVLGAGQTTPEQVVAQWMGSPLHRANILSPDFGDIGVGIAVGPGTWSNGRQDPQVIWWAVDFGEGLDGPASPSPPPPPAPAPAVSGYATLDGQSVSGAPFGSLILISGQNLGTNGAITFHGQASSAVSWSPSAILAIVPLQFSYPDTGPVTVTLQNQVAVGPSFTTEQPGSPVLLPPASLPAPGAPPSSSPAAGGSPATPAPVISAAVDANDRPLQSAGPGQLLFLRGSGFGANLLRQNRVLFVTSSGAQWEGAVWDWSDSRIAVFAPYQSGPVQVVVQLNGTSSPVASNRVSILIQ